MQGSKKVRLALLPSIVCLIAMLLAGCGNATSTTQTHTKAADNKQVLKDVAIGAGIPDLKTLDPAKVTDLYSGIAIQDIFTGLVTLDNSQNVVGELAQSWEVDQATHLIWTFHLKSGLTFSDGTPLTADDVAYSIDRAFQKATKSPTANYYMRYILDSDKLSAGKIPTIIGDSLIVKDKSTLQIKLNQAIPFFLDTLTFPCSYVVEKSLVQAYSAPGQKWTDHLGDGKGGGSGPWTLKSYVHSQQLVLVPNPNYYGPKPQLKELIYPFYKDPDSTRGDYLANRLDTSTVPLADYKNDKSRSDFFKFLFLSTNYYSMQYTVKPWDNIKIRQAFALAINKQKIVDDIWKGSFQATNHIIPQGMYGYNPNLKGPDGTTNVTGNPTQAKKLFQDGLKEEGWSSASQIPAAGLTLSYASAGNPATKAEVTELLQEWHDVLGVTVTANDMDFNALIAQTSNGSQNTLPFYSGPAWISDYPDPEDWTTLQFDAGQGQNGMNYGQNNSSAAAEQQAVQKKMEAADLMPGDTPAERDARAKAYNDIEQQLVNDVAWLPTEQQYAFGLRKPCVQGYPQNGQGLYPPQSWHDVYISTDTCANLSVDV